jgi:hypothetical protein
MTDNITAEKAREWFANLDQAFRDNIITFQYILCTSCPAMFDKVIEDYKHIIKNKDSEIDKLKKENEVISQTVGFKMIENTVSKQIKELETKLRESSYKIETAVNNSQHDLKQQLSRNTNELTQKHFEFKEDIISNQNKLENKLTSNFSKGIIGEAVLSDFFAKIPGVALKDISREACSGDLLISYSGLNIAIESKNTSVVSKEHVDRFKSDVRESVYDLDFAIFIAQRAKIVNGSHFSLEIMYLPKKCVFLFYIADAYNNHERITSALNIGRLLVEHSKTNQNAYEIVSQINDVYSEITTLKTNSQSLKKSAGGILELINKNEDLINELHAKIQSIIKPNTHEYKDKICRDIIKRFVLNGTYFTLEDIFKKTFEYSISKNQTKQIIKKLGGLVQVKSDITEEIKTDTSCDVFF